MKYFKSPVLLLIISLLMVSCFDDSDDNGLSANEINDFVWKGMNVFYLYKENSPNLSNDKFNINAIDDRYGSTAAYTDYLSDFFSPEDLFESLIYERETVDRFSWIDDNYFELEQKLSGISLTNGMEYNLFRYPDNSNNVFGIVTHVLPNTNAESQGVLRGDIFYAIDDTQLTTSNFSTLLSQDNYSIALGNYDTKGTTENNDDTINPINETKTLIKAQYTENPIYIDNILNVSGKNIGYLMYNAFNGSSSELNTVFANFKSNNIEELVIDLRYNRGGRVNKTILLASLITGQFTNDVFALEEWNDEFQEAIENENPELLINRFINNEDGMTLNSLNLSKVYILTSKTSASASELVINCLDPYINVIQIGTNTAGKYQASTTVYDSDNFGREGANPNHTYAMQPLIYKSSNANGVTDYFDGLIPDIELGEQLNNMGVLGDVNERLLAAAIDNILGTGKSFNNKGEFKSLKSIKNSKDLNSFKNNGLVSDKELPTDLIKKIIFE